MLWHSTTWDWFTTRVGVARTEGVEWERKSAEQGYTGCSYSVWQIDMYWGNGVSKSRFQAEAWYRKAAEKGHARIAISN